MFNDSMSSRICLGISGPCSIHFWLDKRSRFASFGMPDGCFDNTLSGSIGGSGRGDKGKSGLHGISRTTRVKSWLMIGVSTGRTPVADWISDAGKLWPAIVAPYIQAGNLGFQSISHSSLLQSRTNSISAPPVHESCSTTLRRDSRIPGCTSVTRAAQVLPSAVTSRLDM